MRLINEDCYFYHEEHMMEGTQAFQENDFCSKGKRRES